MVHTLSRNKSAAAIKSGSYANLRIYGISGNMNPDMPWTTLKAALESNPDQDSSLFMQFSSTCYYFGESLTEELAKSGPAPPIGLIHTAWGGSTIEQWLDNGTIATCANTSISAANGEWHETRVMPYIDMTVKGWVWYQGENDMHGVFGNSGRKTGYSCMMPALVDSWRKLWSAEAGTTDPTAPFGLVTLAPSGGEGGNDIGTMRWAQTAGYGHAPNTAMPNTFLAQAYDLNDPFSNITCYHIFGCPVKPKPPTGWGGCTAYCESLEGTNYYMVRMKRLHDRMPPWPQQRLYTRVCSWNEKELRGCVRVCACWDATASVTRLGRCVAHLNTRFWGLFCLAGTHPPAR